MYHLALFGCGSTLGYEQVYQCRVTRPRRDQETQHRAAHVVTLSKRDACCTKLSGSKRNGVSNRQEQG